MGAKLLLADDSVTIQRVIELTFADQDVQVLTVSDGQQAIERVKAERPDIVLADVAMPERDGYEVAAFIKGDPELSQIPVLLLTGAFEPVDHDRVRTLGCEGVLVKPFEPQLVINLVRSLLAGQGRGHGTIPGSSGQVKVLPEASPTAAVQPLATEDYFKRLDAAFAQKNPTTAAGTEPEQTRSGLSLSEAFAALLAAERGQPVVPSAQAPAALSDEVIDEIARRVIGRMGDDAMRTAVLDTAERLVREEIERIKKAAGTT
jgi:CheY-like chemotaxis protein